MNENTNTNNIENWCACAEAITPLGKEAMAATEQRWNQLAKPPGSLGALEQYVTKLSGITQGDLDISKRCIIIMCGDNGIVKAGVASAPSSVTLTQTVSFTKGLTGVATLAKAYHAALMVVDVGIDNAYDGEQDGIINRKVAMGTKNFLEEPAMSYEEVERCFQIGIEMVQSAQEKGYKIIGLGEMGIGNTTTSSAVLCALLGYRTMEQCEAVTGRGAGLDDTQFQRKKDAIVKGLILHNPDKSNVVDILSKVGGFDLAAMTGAYIGAACYKIPVVVDGFISIVAALCAITINPLVKDYLFLSHQSFEKGYGAAATLLGQDAPLALQMRLGEGSGCPIMFSILDGAIAAYTNMGTFEDAKVDTGYLEQVKFEIGF